MAWFRYNCKEHGEFKVSLKKRQKHHLCPKCGKECSVILKMPSNQILEKLDNGAMVRSVERLHNIEEIMENRSRKHTEKYGKKDD